MIDRDEVKEMMNKKKTGSETLAAFEEHLNEVTDCSQLICKYIRELGWVCCDGLASHPGGGGGGETVILLVTSCSDPVMD